MLPFLILLVGFVSLDSVEGLKCNEGINATIGGLPTYQWNVRECFDQSRCFSQELQIPLIKANNIHLTMQYGGCISKSYASMITCENMFGKNGNFNPAYLLDMITESQDIFLDMEKDFRKNAMEHAQMLFSGGNGTDEFVAGGMALLENLGFNIEKMSKLQQTIAKLFELTIIKSNSGSVNRKEFKKAGDDFLKALDDLDTKNAKNTENIYKFLANFSPRRDTFANKNGPINTFVESFPGLIKATLPESWKPETWFDVVIEILGDLNTSDLRQSTIDVINTIKKAATIPEKYNKYSDPVFDNLPDMMQQLTRRNFQNAIDPLNKMLEGITSKTDETEKISTAIIEDLKKSFPDITIPEKVYETIPLIPGLFYEIFPKDKAEINRVYLKLAKVIKTDFEDTNTAVLEETKMSEFFNKMSTLAASPGLSETEKRADKVLIINLSKTIHDLMDSEQIKKTDIIFDTLLKGFKNFSTVDAGKIISDLVKNLGGTVPPIVTPILKHLQKFIDVFYDKNGEIMLQTAMTQIAEEYKTMFPDSDFPDLLDRYVDLVIYSMRYEPFECDYRLSQGFQDCYSRHIKQVDEKRKNMTRISNDISVDFYFALFRYFYDEKTSDEKSELGPYLQLIRLLDPDDVKQLFYDYAMWTENLAKNTPQYATLDAFAQTFNKTIHKMTAKLGDGIKGLREYHRPDSCKYTTCEGELCNSHRLIQNAIPFTKPAPVNDDSKAETTESPLSTTSGCKNTRSSTMILCLSLLSFLVMKL